MKFEHPPLTRQQILVQVKAAPEFKKCIVREDGTYYLKPTSVGEAFKAAALKAEKDSV